MAANSYKIKISPDRTLGPLDFARVQELVRKGRIHGTELTSIAPFSAWKPFTSFPELSELILKKLEDDSKASRPTAGEAGRTQTILSAQATRTMVSQEPPIKAPETEEKEEKSVEFEMPTLREIKPLSQRDQNPDIQKTNPNISIPLEDLIYKDEATKLISTESLGQVLKKYNPAPEVVGEVKRKKGLFGIGKINDADYVTETGKKRLLSKNTAAILAIGILVIGYFSSENSSTPEAPPELFPRTHTFSYVEVNPPPPLGKPDRAASEAKIEAARKLMEKEQPSDYIRATRLLYTAVGKNEDNYSARGLLASAYLRIIEIIPRDEQLFDALKKLLIPRPSADKMSADYVVALAEYYLSLQRYDQAEEAVDAYIKVRPTAELYYQKAIIELEKKNVDNATAFASKTLPPEGIVGNPRHLLLYAQLLDKKNQKASVVEVVKRIRKENPWYGPAIFFDAELKFRSADYAASERLLSLLVKNPALLNRIELANAFVLLAKTYDAKNNLKLALRFAEGARSVHPDTEATDDLIYRIKSRLPNTKKTYGLILAGRQAERAKQIDEATRLYIQARENDREDPIPNLLLARLYFKNGQIFDAIDRYEKCSAMHKRPIEAPLELADIYINRYDFEKAKVQLNLVDELHLRKDSAQMLRAKILLMQGKKPLASAMFKKTLSQGSRLPALFLQMGDFESELNDRDHAEFYYALVLRYDQLNSNALLGVALARFYLESPSRAISFLKGKLAEQPNSASIMTSLAVIYLSSGDQDSGKSYLQNAIRNDPHYAMAFKLLGDLTRDEGAHQPQRSQEQFHSYKYALASYEMYSKLAPNDPEGYRATGDLYFNVGDLGAAAKNYHQVLNLAPNYPGINLRLGMISENGQDVNEALSFINRELLANPASDAAYVELGKIHLMRREFPESIKELTKAIVMNEKNVEAIETLGKANMLQGNLDNALSLFQRVTKLNPLYTEAYWEIGLIYQRQNNRPKAIQALTNLLGLTQDPKIQSDARRKIIELSN